MPCGPYCWPWITTIACTLFPERIKGKAKEALEEIRKAHQPTINASVQAIREAEAQARSSLAQAVSGIVDRAIGKIRSETLKYAI